MGLAVFSLLLLCGAAFADLSSEYKNNKMLDSNYMLYWTHNATSKMMNIALQVKKTGWVAFGFTEAKSTSMKDYDVCIGYVDGDSKSLKDYLTDGYMPPNKDATNDCVLDDAMVSEGTTTLKYHRKVDTGDSKDVVIKTGEIITVWAYKNTEKMLSKHDVRGFTMITMINSDNRNATHASATAMTTKPTITSGIESTKLKGFHWKFSVALLSVIIALFFK